MRAVEFVVTVGRKDEGGHRLKRAAHQRIRDLVRLCAGGDQLSQTAIRRACDVEQRAERSISSPPLPDRLLTVDDTAGSCSPWGIHQAGHDH